MSGVRCFFSVFFSSSYIPTLWYTLTNDVICLTLVCLSVCLSVSCPKLNNSAIRALVTTKQLVRWKSNPLVIIADWLTEMAETATNLSSTPLYKLLGGFTQI